jgi:hypothetical protein
MILSRKCFIILFLIFSSVLNIKESYADDWDEFYNKYSQRAFIVSWNDKWINSDGIEKSNWHHEFGYTMMAPDRLRNFTRNTDLQNNSEPLARWDENIRKGDFRNNGRNWINTYEINKNTIIDSTFWKTTTTKESTLAFSLKISVTNNGCRAVFTNDDLRLLDGWTFTRRDVKCVVVDK